MACRSWARAGADQEGASAGRTGKRRWRWQRGSVNRPTATDGSLKRVLVMNFCYFHFITVSLKILYGENVKGGGKIQQVGVSNAEAAVAQLPQDELQFKAVSRTKARRAVLLPKKSTVDQRFQGRSAAQAAAAKASPSLLPAPCPEKAVALVARAPGLSPSRSPKSKAGRRPPLDTSATHFPKSHDLQGSPRPWVTPSALASAPGGTPGNSHLGRPEPEPQGGCQPPTEAPSGTEADSSAAEQGGHVPSTADGAPRPHSRART